MTDRAYARISLDTAASGSIDKQRTTLAKKADDDVVFYEDRSASGSIPFAERDGGRALLADLRPGDRVLVTKIDRAARDVMDLLGLVKRVKETGATIVFTEQADVVTEGPMGDLLLTLLGAVAQFERALIAERRRESLAAFREEGRHAVGRAPFGLRSVPNPNGRGLVLRPHPEEAPILRDVVERLLAGTPQRRLSAEVGMQHPAFGRLLRNERLAGVRPGIDPKGGRIDPEQAVFSLSEWARLQDYLGRPEKSWARAEGYGAALACGVCGERLYFNSSARKREYATYRCRGVRHEKGAPAASVIRVNADRVVEDEFLRRFGSLPVLDVVEVGSSEARDDAIARARLNLEAIRAEQDKAADEAEDERLFAAYRRARRALREAEALPAESRFEERPTGQTFAEAWAVADDVARVSYLRNVGPWIVEPGRLPIGEKVHLDPAREDYLAGQTDDVA